ncbi:MAG: helix-turn-helix domain-containing protein [Pseudomonadota bacterium]
MAKRINPRRVKIHLNYDFAEAARRIGVHKNTVRNWVRSGELPAFTDRRPHIIRGADLRDFLERRQASARTKCPSNHLYCFRCRAPRTPQGMVADLATRLHGAGNLRATCAVCGGAIHQRCNQHRLSERFPDVRIFKCKTDNSRVDGED